MTPQNTRRPRSPLQSLYFGMATVLLLRSCAGVTPIKTLLDDPGRFDGKTVRIAGEVQRAIGALGFGAYELKDETGSMPVVSEANGAPRTGARVGVEGTFKAAFTLGTQSASVLMEKRRYTP